MKIFLLLFGSFCILVGCAMLVGLYIAPEQVLAPGNQTTAGFSVGIYAAVAYVLAGTLVVKFGKSLQ